VIGESYEVEQDVENIIVRNIQLAALPKQPDILQLRAKDSKKIVLVLPR
jgi:hypothetical protein